MNFLIALTPEIILIGAACLLFLLAAFPGVIIRRSAPWITLTAMMAAMVVVAIRMLDGSQFEAVQDVILLSQFSSYVKALSLVVGVLLLLVNWPTDADGSGNASLRLESEGPEYFGLMLLSITGVMLVASANDLILLFLAIELASIPTYVMVSMSRPISIAQEAAVKYFFLGAFSAALTLFGLSFLFGVTGSLTLTGIAGVVSGWIATGGVPAWLILGGMLVMVGLAFKLAAFPLHFYAPDVYTGAATPLTALLSFVPKAAGIVGLIRVLYALSGGHPGDLPSSLATALWFIAVFTMTIGNVLGLMQQNVKRMMACSSIAHSGYMLTGLAVLFGTPILSVQDEAIAGVLFYLTAYGLTNLGVFAVLMMLPAKADPFNYEGKIPPGTTAETLSDLAGTGRRHVGLGLIMAACCFSLIGIPLTMGFLGKFYLLRPLLAGGFTWLAVIMVLNAAISAGYYLRIVSAMFLKEPREAAMGMNVAVDAQTPRLCTITMPLMLAGILAAGGGLALGTYLEAAAAVRTMTLQATDVAPPVLPTPSRPIWISLEAPHVQDGTWLASEK